MTFVFSLFVYACIASAMPPKSKRPRLAPLLAIRGVTDTALSQILAELEAHPELLELPHSRATIQRANLDIMNEIGHVLKVPLKSGGEFDWHVPSLPKLLTLLVSKGPGFASLLKRSLDARAPNDPCRIVLYFDEVVPRDPLKSETNAKVMCYYISFLEFGNVHLSHVDAWIPVACLRSKILSKVRGSQSCILRLLLRSWFVGPDSIATGVVLALGVGGCPKLVQFRLSNVLADEEALHLSTDFKGASGVVPCIKCKNVTSANHSLAGHDTTGYIVDIREADFRKFDARTDQDVWNTYDILATAHRDTTRGCKGRLAQKEKESGMNFNANSVWSDLDLRAHFSPSAISYDSCHCALSDGVLGVDIYLFFEAATQEDFPTPFVFPDLHKFLTTMGWIWPRGGNDYGVRRLFAPSRVNGSHTAGHWKGQASEFLQAYPLLRHFATCILPVFSEEKLESFLCCCRVVDMLQAAKRGIIDLDAYSEAVSAYIAAFAKAYPDEAPKPKSHFLFHLLEAANDFFVDAFVGERKHQMLKMVSNPIDNDRLFEKSVISRALLCQVQQCAKVDYLANALLGKSVESTEGARFAKGMHYEGNTLRTGDIIMLQRSGEFFKVLACCTSGESFIIGVAPYEVQEKVTQHSYICTRGVGLMWVDVAPPCKIFPVAAWSNRADGNLLIVL